jgi:hypothetical protein
MTVSEGYLAHLACRCTRRFSPIVRTRDHIEPRRRWGISNRHSSISIAKNENSLVVLLFSQSIAARWSAWIVSAIHTTVLAREIGKKLA